MPDPHHSHAVALAGLAGPLSVYVRIPVAFDPDERFARFEEPLDSALQFSEAGRVAGGGTMYSAERGDEDREALFCGIDVDLDRPAKGFGILLEELRHLEVPRGTTIELVVDGREYAVEVWTAG
jgi:hypothetical protein